MRVLWFEVTVPRRYNPDKAPTGGWQDALQDVVMQHGDIELTIAFENVGQGEERTIDGVTYLPVNTSYNLWERQRAKLGWQIVIEKVLDRCVAIIERVQPDIIHVFGSEWCFGLVAERTSIPVVIHMQGCIAPYNNALMPPMYSVHDLIVGMGWNPHRQFNAWLGRMKARSRAAMERHIFEVVEYYMGRTDWDRNLVQLFHPSAKYYLCNEALRSAFIETAKPWSPPRNKTFRIVTTGMGSFWKGIETILRTAHILKEQHFDFEWICLGRLSDLNQRIVESREGMRYADNNIVLKGNVSAEQVQDILLSADLYVHTAYIDNSPNAVCEAQYLGLPIIATYVGGIPSLIDNGKEGLLVPANAPYTLAGKIIEISHDEARCRTMGKASRQRALERHNPVHIYSDLLDCYRQVIEDSRKDAHAPAKG